MRGLRASLLLVALLVCGAAPAVQAKGVCTANKVLLDTELGPIVVKLYPKLAPASAADFLRYVDKGLYTGAGFYRTVRADNDNGSPRIDVIQGGLLELGSRLPPVPHESTKMTGLRHVDGSLSLARAAVGTGSAAGFFISIGKQPALDYGALRNPDGQGFAVFGRVKRGMDVIRKIHAVPAAGLGGEGYMKGQLLTKPVMFRSAHRICR